MLFVRNFFQIFFQKKFFARVFYGHFYIFSLLPVSILHIFKKNLFFSLFNKNFPKYLRTYYFFIAFLRKKLWQSFYSTPFLRISYGQSFISTHLSVKKLGKIFFFIYFHYKIIIPRKFTLLAL